ncbi:DUF4905 domain-containing protein [Mucilaginibacter xinganensis]|uniref:DUF4905 domain-containing protein n=1 Tax=Mucilaginibacter xinganensis TaxID=1234841 RepID=A0A223NWX0_9SPHI|nr:DUF4905 domain-containing protein [Mucilaginibacter xinganensis]ASU34051.1 hypothetical protein MuYL_2161 [Mucilaginibacter xinganensis]
MTLLPHISQQFPGIIWRMEIDALTETLFVEIRDNDEKKVCFGSAGLQNGKIYFDSLTTPERWLTGIETAYDGVLLIHYYQSETGPAHKGLLAVDAFTGKTLWSNYTLGFDHLTANGPVVYDSRLQPRKLFLADIKTGATIRIYEPYLFNDPANNIRVPEQLAPELLPPNLIIHHSYSNWVHYLEHNNFRIVSLHALKAGQLVQLLYVFDGQNKVYEDLLNSDIQKIQPEAFIMHKNCLIYIKNKVELKVLSL